MNAVKRCKGALQFGATLAPLKRVAGAAEVELKLCVLVTVFNVARTFPLLLEWHCSNGRVKISLGALIRQQVIGHA